MGFLLNIANVLDKIARNAGKAAGWLMIPLIFVIMFDVVTRKIDVTRLFFADFSIAYGYSISTILQDLQWHFHGALLMLSFGFGYLANAHVRVDIFREMLPRRKQAWVEMFGLVILAIPFLVVMISYSLDLVVISFNQGEGSESLTGIPYRWFIKGFVVIGFLIAMASVIATLSRLIAFVFSHERHQQEALDKLEIFADESELEEARLAAERALKEEAERALQATHATEGR